MWYGITIEVSEDPAASNIRVGEYLSEDTQCSFCGMLQYGRFLMYILTSLPTIPYDISPSQSVVSCAVCS